LRLPVDLQNPEYTTAAAATAHGKVSTQKGRNQPGDGCGLRGESWLKPRSIQWLKINAEKTKAKTIPKISGKAMDSSMFVLLSRDNRKHHSKCARGKPGNSI
jgi:hypothetical protein